MAVWDPCLASVLDTWQEDVLANANSQLMGILQCNSVNARHPSRQRLLKAYCNKANSEDDWKNVEDMASFTGRI